MATYIAELLHLSEHCEFGSTINKMLRYRLVCGVKEPKIQRRLLAKPDLSDKAFELTQASESADKDAKNLQKWHRLPLIGCNTRSPFVTIVEINIV